MDEIDGYLKRAFAAYYRSYGESASIPSGNDPLTGVVNLNGKRYVYLGNHGGLLAAYRIGNNGLLRRLRRVPKEITSIWPKEE
jgi:hypothetical protein